jgi:hypothetical protein
MPMVRPADDADAGALVDAEGHPVEDDLGREFETEVFCAE